MVQWWLQVTIMIMKIKITIVVLGISAAIFTIPDMT